ncbi:MAG TPA: lysylphosphatidylglycerol synthase transmembrane domain-containing protein [Polyangia bacterium]|nr:lysylphosphatidylglycerol synthase transmembrane domain-containing protein [Polyangia bacterium]
MKSRFWLKLCASLAVGAVCVAYALAGVNGREVVQALRELPLSSIGVYVLILAVTHLFRTWRWEFLLRPLGVALPPGRLLAVSSVGFMAILTLPVRLGEFVRPYLVARERHTRMSTALGTVAVERIVDGLLISILFFVSYLASAGDSFPRELRVAAWLSLLGFLGLGAFLALAQLWTEATIRIALRLSLLQWLAPKQAAAAAERVRAVITGFRVLRDPRNLCAFLLQSIIYWGSNGLGMWYLARQMNLPISAAAAFATMAFTGVVLTLPNAPGLVGQFHAAIKMGLLAYLPAAVVNGRGVAYAIVLHGVQTIWYVVVGMLAMLALSAGGRAPSLAAAVRASNRAAEAPNLEVS